MSELPNAHGEGPEVQRPIIIIIIIIIEIVIIHIKV